MKSSFSVYLKCCLIHNSISSYPGLLFRVIIYDKAYVQYKIQIDRAERRVGYDRSIF